MNSAEKNEEIIFNEDPDVSNERAKVLSNYPQDDPIVIKEIKKSYVRKNSVKKDYEVAIRNMSLSLENGQILGLIGPKRSGKTTILKLITNESLPDKGHIISKGDVVNIDNLQKFHNQIGFCPQYNSFWNYLTLFEHLVFYASLRRIPENTIKSRCCEIISALEMEEYSNKLVKHLNVGTKRKLSFALSVFASQKIILLDEPTIGMDAKSKRLFWQTINLLLRNKEKSVIITTNSMEEAEALCDRVGVIVKGELKCLGSIQYLKEKFKMGYTLEAKINMKNQSAFIAFIEQLTMQQASLIENFSNKFIIQIPEDCVKSLALMFDKLEKAKSEDIINWYNFSQCRFEQRYLQFLKNQW